MEPVFCVQQAVKSRACLNPLLGEGWAAVLAVCPRQEEFLELAPVWLHLGLGLTDLLGAAVFLQKDSQEKELCALPSP